MVQNGSRNGKNMINKLLSSIASLKTADVQM